MHKAMHPGRTFKRWARRKVKRLAGRKTVRHTKRQREKHFGGPVQRKGGRHDIVPGRTIIEWLTHPEMGRGRVLAHLPGRSLDVEFESGGRPPSGVPIEDVRVLA